MSYRVLIPTAGTGSRLGAMTKFVNKSLVAISNRPVISHIIEQFPQDSEFVIGLGYKGDLVKEFLTLAYPKRKFYFVNVTPYEGSGSGLGLTILQCKELLQGPFIFSSCDTLVRGAIPPPDMNWMGYALVENSSEYRTLDITEKKVCRILEKMDAKANERNAYIGLCGIKDYSLFWKSMEQNVNEATVIGESFGLQSLIHLGVIAKRFSWYDTGNMEALKLTRGAYIEPNQPNILEKENEAIWFVNNKVIKYSDDAKFIFNRVKRAKLIEKYVPKVENSTTNMYLYSRAEGGVLSNGISLPLFDKLLKYSQGFWKKEDLSTSEMVEFQKSCTHFYRNKTIERIELFLHNFNKKDGSELINGINIPSIKKLMTKMDWNWLTEGMPGRFHGDFHFENILYSKNEDKFTFLDWRQDFGGSMEIGDIYYDFAKLLHGLIISHELIAKEHYKVEWTKEEIQYDFFRKQILVECERYFLKWIKENGYDQKKVVTLTAIVFLNIAALHHYPYSLLLFALGKKMLNEAIGG